MQIYADSFSSDSDSIEEIYNFNEQEDKEWTQFEEEEKIEEEKPDFSEMSAQQYYRYRNEYRNKNRIRLHYCNRISLWDF